MEYGELVLLLFTTLLVCTCGEGRTLQAKTPFQSHRAPAETIRNYEVHTPVIRNGGYEHSKRMDIEISDYVFHLEINHGLVSSHFTSQYYDDVNGNQIVEEGHVNCFYQGKVKGHPGWHIAVSTCHGLHGSFGELGNKENYYHIEPLDHMDTSLEQPHVIYSTREYAKRNETCGTTHPHDVDKTSHISSIPSQVHLNRDRVRRQVNGFYIVEWAMINDFTQYNYYDGNLSAVVLRDLEIANYVDSLYQTLSVRVVVVHVITWTAGDRITYPSDNDPNELLNNLEGYEPQVTPAHDSTMLITGVNLLGNTVGIAFVGTMCNSRNSVGLSQDGGRSTEGVGSTAAHELGHIFSMDHDDIGQCTCNDPSDSCIMSASSGFPSPVEWSSCSRSDIMNGFTVDNLNRCLGNEPDVTVGDPLCGNGIREKEEICDCGTLEECVDPCCNATSCVLNEGAMCGEGECCTENCQLRPLGYTCRPVSSESLGCDILEYCSGESSDCPRDVHRQDGQTCNDGSDSCYSGTCQIRNNQCGRLFGSETAAPECYSDLNIRGIGAGNCGYAGGNYVACASEDVRCGQLQCGAGDYIGMLGVSITIFTRSASGNTCRSVTTAPTSDFVSPGLVADGIICGNGTICVTQSCTAISDLDYIQSCPVGGNNLTCAGEGVCNNLNQCSCNVGKGGATCTTQTIVATGSSNVGLIIGIIIGILLLIAIITGVTVGVVFLVLILPKRKESSYLPSTTHSASTSTSVQVVNKPVYRPLLSTKPSPNVKRPPPPKVTPPVNRSAPPPRPPPASRPAPPSQKAPPPQKKAPPPSAASKPGKVQKQWPPPSSPGDSKKPLPPPTRKPVFPPRK